MPARKKLSKTVPKKPASAAGTGLARQLAEARAQQAATAEILKVIAASPTDVQPVFDSIVQSAARLFGRRAILRTVEGNVLLLRSFGAASGSKFVPAASIPLDRDSLVGTVVLNGKASQFADALAPDAPLYAQARAQGWDYRANAAVPLIRDARVIGVISMISSDAGLLSDKQLALIAAFADQAVIAIENVRLFNETKEALERQTATADILKVIASSPADVQPVFDAIAGSAMRLIGGTSASVYQVFGEMLHLVSLTSTNPAGDEGLRKHFPLPFADNTLFNTVISTGTPLVRTDTETDPAATPISRKLARARGYRSQLVVPMVREGAVVGAIVVARKQAGQFSDHEIGLLQTFADQAVIAIENVRLFNETRAALERQTATADVLKVIASSPSDVQPVFEAIAVSARRLLGGRYAVVARRIGNSLHLAANTGTTEAGDAALRKLFPTPISGQGGMGKAVVTRAPVAVEDVDTDPAYSQAFREGARSRGMRSMLCVPMLRDGDAIGVITVNRADPGPFTEHQTNLLKTFADQAVIAIENVRLFNETREALERQTATAEILRVISSSPTEVQPVFDAIVQTSKRLLGGFSATVTRIVDDKIHLAAYTSIGESGDLALRSLFPARLSDRREIARAVETKTPLTISDSEAGPYATAEWREMARQRGFRSVLFVPMLRAGTAIGTINVTRREQGAFDDHQIGLLKTFADQAVIAIENVRLFNETKEALEQQTATAEILQVIGSSPTDTQPVFEAIVQSGRRLFPGAMVSVALPEGARVRAAAIAHDDPEVAAGWRERFASPLARDRLHGAAILDAMPIDIPDAQAAVDGPLGPGVRNFLLSGSRAITVMPMLCGEGAIGAISVTRAVPGPLSDKQLSMLRTFAAQAVIAIENVRLFKELEARTEALTRSVGQLKALGEVSQAVSSTLDLEAVLQSIVSRAVQLTGLDGGSIYEHDERSGEFHLRAAENLSDEVIEVLRTTPMRMGEGVIGHAISTGEPAEIPEMLDDSYQSPRRDSLIQAGYRALLVVPLRRDEHIIGALAVNRRAPGLFPHDVIELLKTFATQSALAIQNARLFREIEEKGRQVEVASRHKSDFLANMSHELRTPLNAVIGFSEVLIERMFGELNEKQADYMKDIHESGRHLLSLINDILDLSKIEAGRMDLELGSFDLPGALSNAITLVRERAQRHGIALDLQVDPAIGAFTADERKFKQILLNLLSNAVKFTPDGGRVDVAAKLNGQAVQVAVTDTGVGIAPEDHAAVFEEFKQVGSDYTRKAEGTGLGLALTKRFVELHGGEIRLESSPGAGSTFTFTLPVRA